MKRQSGFTLIELIMVIVILGILAATAMPKFADLKGDARLSAIEGLKGAMDAAAAIAHGTQLTKGYASNVDVVLAGINVSMVNGYPTANASGIVAAMDLSSKYVWIASGVDYDGTLAGNVGRVDGIAFRSDLVSSAAWVPSCYVSYTAATASGVAAITSSVVSGC